MCRLLLLSVSLYVTLSITITICNSSYYYYRMNAERDLASQAWEKSLLLDPGMTPPLKTVTRNLGQNKPMWRVRACWQRVRSPKPSSHSLTHWRHTTGRWHWRRGSYPDRDLSLIHLEIVTCPVDVDWHCPTDFQWHVQMDAHVCDIWCNILP